MFLSSESQKYFWLQNSQVSNKLENHSHRNGGRGRVSLTVSNKKSAVCTSVSNTMEETSLRFLLCKYTTFVCFNRGHVFRYIAGQSWQQQTSSENFYSIKMLPEAEYKHKQLLKHCLFYNEEACCCCFPVFNLNSIILNDLKHHFDLSVSRPRSRFWCSISAKPGAVRTLSLRWFYTHLQTQGFD